MPDGKTIGIISVKGGVGKTTVALSLASSLSKDYRKQVILVDSNLSTPHVGISLGFSQPKTHLHDVLNNKISIFDAIYFHPLGFYVLPGSLIPTEVNPALLKEKISVLRTYFDFIVLDTSPSLHQELFAAIESSDEIYAVTSPDYPTLSSTLHAVSMAKEKGLPIKGIIMNKVRKKSYELTSKEIELATGVPVLSVLQDDSIVLEALSSGIPLPFYEPNHKLSKSYKNLAGLVSGAFVKSPPLFSTLRSFVLKTFSSDKSLKGGSSI